MGFYQQSALCDNPLEVMTNPAPSANLRPLEALAQLGERLLCKQGVCGSQASEARPPA